MNDLAVAWSPTPEQFDAYKSREIALCRAAILRERKQGRHLERQFTLFSQETWTAALAG